MALILLALQEIKLKPQKLFNVQQFKIIVLSLSKNTNFNFTIVLLPSKCNYCSLWFIINTKCALANLFYGFNFESFGKILKTVYFKVHFLKNYWLGFSQT